MTYEQELAALATRVGERNRRLLPIALKGRDTGKDADTLVAEIVAASGTPPLSSAEVRRAVTRAMTLPPSERRAPSVPRYNPQKRRGNSRLSALLKSHATPTSPAYAKATAGKQTSQTYSFVREMIARDADERYRCDLAFRSPVQIMRFPGAFRVDTRRRQALLYLA